MDADTVAKVREVSFASRDGSEAVAVVPRDLAFQYRILPISLRGRTLTIGMVFHDPTTVRELEALTRCRIEVVEVSASDITEGLRRLYPPSRAGRDVNAVVAATSAQRTADQEFNAVMEEALRLHASDVHFETHRDSPARILLRIDGTLVRHWETNDLARFESLSTVVKTRASLSYEERAGFQFGSFELSLPSGRRADVRVTTVPRGKHYEKIVLRLHDTWTHLRESNQLGMHPALWERYAMTIGAPYGIHLLVGPPRSGKTTLFYVVLKQLAEEFSVVTIEDPVELVIPGINQVEVDLTAGVSFASAIVAFVRTDSDVIGCGEVREVAAAQELVNAGMAGRRVFGTFHANSAIDAIERLVEMGIRRGALSGTLKSLMGQRLFRRLCVACRKTAPVPFQFRRMDRFREAANLYTLGSGCQACGGKGYGGIAAAFELLQVTTEIEDAVFEGKRRRYIESLALDEGSFVPLREQVGSMLLAGLVDVRDREVLAYLAERV